MKLLVFPGQGSQFKGMGKALYDGNALAKELYEKAARFIGKKYIDASFEGDDDTIKRTLYSQPIIFLYSYILTHALNEMKKIDLNSYNTFAGHSLGEITAITVSGGFTFDDGVKFVRFRGEAMDKVALPDSGMAALLKPNTQMIAKTLLSDYKGKVFIANDNSPSQIVISGNGKEIERFTAANVKTMFLKAIPLKVSAPFHTPFMKDVEIMLNKELEKYTINEKMKTVYANATANKYPGTSAEIKKTISYQSVSQVKWVDLIKNAVKDGVSEFTEIGPKSIVLSFIKEIYQEAISNSFCEL